MRIYNKTLYNKDLILKYNNYYFINFIMTKFSLMALIVMIFSIYLLTLRQYKYVITLFAILLAYLILMYLVQKATTNRAMKKNPIVESPFTQEYLFTDEELIISLNKKILYTHITKIKITKQFFLLFSLDKRTYIVNNDGFSTKEEESLVKEKLIQLIKNRKHSKRTKQL
ncbi:MAG: YcxB family protein [Candidatus Izemoplasmatales bacterium]|nr:YcxB family protein [Candidatus Izemoplasmatales bacterium]